MPSARATLRDGGQTSRRLSWRSRARTFLSWVFAYIKMRIISGYEGTPAIGLAMEKGEVDAVGDWSSSSLKVQRPEWIRDKKINILLQGALEKDPELPDVPNALAFVKDDLSRRALELCFTQKTVAAPSWHRQMCQLTGSRSCARGCWN